VKGLEILQVLENKGIEIRYERESERLILAPKRLVTPDLLAEIRAHRGEILQRIFPLEARGYSHLDFVFRVARLEQARQSRHARVNGSTGEPPAAPAESGKQNQQHSLFSKDGN